MTDKKPERTPGITPAELADLLPAPLVMSTAPNIWPAVTVQRLRYQPGSVDIPSARDHRVALHLAGPTLIEEKRNRHERRWSDGGHVSLIPSGVPASRDLKGRPDFLLIHVPPELSNEVTLEAYDIDPASVELVSHLAVPDPNLDRVGRLLQAEAEANAPGGRLVAEMLTRTLIVHLLRGYSSLSLPTRPASEPTLRPRLKRVVDYMHAHLANDLSLAELAVVGGLSPSQFARAFRKATGEPPHRYLVGLRIAQARIELGTTTLTVIEIGLRCGFQQPSHFATSFREIVGMSPRAYRLARQS